MRILPAVEANLHESDLQARREERDLEDRRLELLKVRLNELREEQQTKMRLDRPPAH
jgi:hypothetical protein